MPTKKLKTAIGNIETKVYQQHKVYGKDHYQVLLITIPKDFTIVNATTVNDSLLVFKSADCKRKKGKEFNEDLAKKMENRYWFWCRETAFIYNKCLDRCQRFGEASLPEEKESYSNLTMQDIADADYKHAKWIGKILK